MRISDDQAVMFIADPNVTPATKPVVAVKQNPAKKPVAVVLINNKSKLALQPVVGSQPVTSKDVFLNRPARKVCHFYKIMAFIIFVDTKHNRTKCTRIHSL